MKSNALNREMVAFRSLQLNQEQAGSLGQIPGIIVDETNDEGRFHVRAPRNTLGILRAQRIFAPEDAPSFAHHDPQTRPLILREPLFQHQRIAVDRISTRGSILLGDQMGLGKTRTALAAAAAVTPDGHSVLIMGPKYVESVWRAEIAAMGLERGGFWAARGVKPDEHPMVQGTTWLFCHYDILRHWWNALSFVRFKAVIFDEGHLVKNPRSARGKAAALVTPGTAVRMVLTGTPVQNNLSEAHALLTLASGPGTWGRELAFRRRYVGAHPTDYGWQDGGATNVEELQTRLDDIYLRRDVSVLEDKLPERVRRKVEVDVPPALREQVQNVLSGYTPKQILETIRRSQGGKDTIGWLVKLRKATSRAKLETTIALASSIIEQGDSVLIFAWQRETVEKLAAGVEKETGAFCVHGGFWQTERDARVQMWKSSPIASALVASYGTLSTGVTLTKANHVIFHDLDMVPANMLQAEARVYRIGATRPVQSWWVVAKDTLDPFIFSLVNRKAPATAVFGDLGTGELGDFFGNTALDKELEELFTWSLTHSE